MGVVTVPRRKVWTRQPPRLVGIEPDNPLAAGLVAAYLPTPFGWLDATAFANHATTASNPGGYLQAGRSGVGASLEIYGSGYGYQAGAATPVSAAGFSAALWVKFAAIPTSYGQHFTRAAGSGGDWELSNDATAKKLAYARNGATLYAPTTAVDTEWHLWHWSLSSSGAGAMYTDGGLNSSATGLTVRDANGAVYIGKRSDAYPCNSQIGTAYMWARPTTAAEALELYRNEWRLFRKRPARIFLPAAGGSYSLTCAAGNYALTGQAVALRASRSLAAAQGSYALTGQDVALRRLYTLTAGQGGYSLSGQAVALAVSRLLAAGQGSYTLTGQAVGLLASRVLAAGQGSYALSGQAVGLVYTPLGSYTLLASAGAYTLTGQAVGLLASRVLAAGQGSYALSGQAVGLVYTPLGSYTLLAGSGSYTLTGQAVGLLASRVLAAAAGSYGLSGQAVGLTYTPAGASYTLTASAGSYALSGQAVNFGRTYVLTAAPGSYVLTGQAVSLSYSGAPPAEIYAAISALRRQMVGGQASSRPAQSTTTRRPPQ